VRLHLGTAEVRAAAIVLDGRQEIAPGESAYCRLRLREPIATLRGDPFILRTETAEATLGGGVVVQAFASPHRRREEGLIACLEVLHRGAPREALGALLDLQEGLASSCNDVAQGLGLTEDEVVTLAGDAAGVLALPSAAQPEAFVALSRFRRLAAAATEIVRGWHAENPLLPGMELESLRTRLPEVPDARVYRWLVDGLVADGVLARSESVVRLPDHRVALDQRARQAALRIEAVLGEAGLTPPDVRSLEGEGLSGKDLQDVLAVLEREGRVVRVSPDLYYAREAVERGVALVRDHCTRHREITAAAFRDLIGASRKYSIAFLDYCDRSGITVRVGDVRRLR
jgi:selenocysteine-specific elongation factor